MVIEHPKTATSLNNLGLILDYQGRYRNAEELHRRALAIREKALGPEHPDTAGSYNNLAEVLRAQARYGEAEALHRHALTIREKMLGPEHPDTAGSCNNLAEVLRTQGRYGEAESLHRRALAIYEKVLGTEHPHVATSLNNLAVVMRLQGRYREAELLYRRALALDEEALGPGHPETATSLNNLALVLRFQGRAGEAEPLLRRALAIREQTLGAEHPLTAISLNTLAEALRIQSRYEEAEPLYRRALAIREEVLGVEHPDTATSLNNLALALQAQGCYGEAESLHRRALAIYENVLGIEHPMTATSLNNLAELLRTRGHDNEAEPLYRRALAIHERVLGPEHPYTAVSLNNLAVVLEAQSRYEDAESLYRRALAIAQQAEEPNILLPTSRNLGFFLTERGHRKEAIPYYQTAIDTLDQLFAYTQGLAEEARHTFLGQYAHYYREFIELLLQLYEQNPKAGYDREVLAVASRNQSRIFSELLRQADVRDFSTDPTFIELQQRWQNLHAQRATLGEERSTIPISAPDAETRKINLGQEIAKVDAELATVKQRLQSDYPRFLELQQPAPVTVEQLQQTLLQPREALLSLVLLPERTVLLAVTRERFTLRTVAVTEQALTDRVRHIREPLEQVSKLGTTDPLEKLDPAVLHALYQDLIAPVKDTLQGAKRVLVVADGPLYNLPLEMLVTAYGETEQRAFERAARLGKQGTRPYLGEYATLPYLADRYRFSYLPSLAALASQRHFQAPSEPRTRELIAFANPIFKEQANPPNNPVSVPHSPVQNAQAILQNADCKRTMTDLALLPGTAEEVRAIAELLTGEKRLYLDYQAQEHTVKLLSAQKQFHGLRYLIFATHGLLSDESLPPPSPVPRQTTIRLDQPVTAVVREKCEPALALTGVGDLHGEDGFLTMSEVLGLSLDTDLVVLSACNTAGEKANQGEGFVGLTRSFLHAGAGRLLVSHWKVASDVTGNLMAVTFTQLQAGQPPLEALAEARRQVRNQTIQEAPSVHVSRAHPFFWAPFVVVGD